MSNTITAFFKGRVGVAEAVYQNDYGIVMNFDSIELPAHFDCYFSTTEGDEAIPGIGADRQVVIPNECLSRPGNVVLHIPMHTGANDSEVEYVVYFKVIGRARPMDDGTPVQMTAIEQALALLQNPIGNIEQIVNEALAFTGDTFAEMQAQLDEDQAEFQTEIRGAITDVESDFDNLDAQFQTAVSALTVDSEVQNIRVGDDDVIYTSAGEAVRTQFSNVKSDLSDSINEQTRNLLDGVVFEKGSLNGGAESSSSSRIRSKYIDVSDIKALKITVVSGYKYTLNFYDDTYTWIAYTMGGFYSGLFDWQTTNRTVPLIPPKLKYMRVLIADTSDSTSIAITDTDKLNIQADYSLLNTQESQNNAINLLNGWLDGKSSTINHNVWANGVALAGLANWEINNSATRIWSGVIEAPQVSAKLKLTTTNGYKCAYYFYDSTWTKVAENYWSTSYDVAIPSTTKYIVISVATTNDDSITPDKGENVAISFEATTDSPNHIQHIENITNNSAIDLGWELGTLESGKGSELTSTTRIRSNFILVGKGTELILNDSNYRHLYYKYDLSKAYKSDVGFTSKKLYINEDCYIRILMCKDGNGTITSGEVSTISAKEEIFRAFPQVMVGEDADDTKDIPSYFVSEISSAISTVKSNAFDVGIDGDSFVFITDVHWQSNSKHSPALVKQVIDSINVGKIVCGGDLIGGGGKSAMIDLMSDCIKSFKNISRFYVLLGNHDTNKLGADSPSDYFSKGEAYALMQKESDFIMDYGNPCYFFFDNPTTKTRYICLDTGEESTALDTTQSNWLSNTLASMPSGYHALIFAHIIYQTTTTWHIGLQPSELERTSFMNDVCNILDTFNANSSDKSVEAIFGGHTHIDADFVTSGGIPIVLTDCDTRQTFTETSSGSGVANHAVGTINEQCFDITTIDYANKTIKCVRVGRGSNRTITY